MTETAWSETDLSQIDGHDEVRIASLRPDGTLSSGDAALIARVAIGVDNHPASGVIGGFSLVIENASS